MTSERWAGFTDEDIERIKSHPDEIKPCFDKICEFGGSTTTSVKKGPMKIKGMPMKYTEEDYSNEIYAVKSASERKMKNISPTVNKKEITLENSKQENYRLTETEEQCSCNNYALMEREIGITETGEVAVQDIHNEKSEGESEEMNQQNANFPALELFELRQKRIEEENARRRALINKAINDKRLQTHAEAIKLAKISQELNLIDCNLSSDIAILRNYIEKASQEFSEAEKRYLKAEKEFVEAKLVLFDKMQRKEMLTEHLCAIIEQNENRKADKLVELMKQLDMEVIVDDFEVNGLEPILPNLCALNEESYHSCHTIKPNLSKENSEEKIFDCSQRANDQEKLSEVKDTESIPDTPITAGSTSVDGTQRIKEISSK